MLVQRELERLVRMRKTLKKGIFTIWRRKRNNYFKDHKGQVCVHVQIYFRVLIMA